MICYAECFNTLINIFKVFHEPLLKALLPFIEHSAFYKGKISSAPPNQLMNYPLQPRLAEQRKTLQTPTYAPNISQL